MRRSDRGRILILIPRPLYAAVVIPVCFISQGPRYPECHLVSNYVSGSSAITGAIPPLIASGYLTPSPGYCFIQAVLVRRHLWCLLSRYENLRFEVGK